jgi:hypothetical protein
MSNNINQIIELQQTDNNKVENGYFKTNMNYNITLYEGDELSLHSAFLDTVAIENSQIQIDEDTDVSMNFYLYNRLNRDTDIVLFPSDPLPQDKPNGDLVFLARPRAGQELLERHIGFFLTVDTDYKGVYYGQCIINFQYEDSTGKLIKATVQTGRGYPQKKNVNNLDVDQNKYVGGFGMGASGNTRNATIAPDKSDYKFYFFWILGFPIICRPNTLKIVSILNSDGTPTTGKNPNGSSATNETGFKLPFNGNLSTPPQNEFDPYIFPSTGGEVIYEPVMNTKTFTIPKGKYSADEISSVISDNCQLVANQQQFTKLVESPFLIESGDQTASQDIMVKALSDGTIEAYKYNSNQWIGASAISLKFNPNDNKMFWEFIHTPYYDDNGTIIVSFNASQDGNTEFYGSSNGGIVFNSLEPASFWQDKLGFDTSLQIHPQHTSGTLDGDDVQVPVFNVQASKQFTTAQVIADVGIQKNNNFFKVPTIGTGGASAGEVASANSNLTSVIPSKTALFETSADTGFYYLEINSNFKNDFYTETQNFNTISGIISNYYNINSYTSADSSAGIPYVHTGNPITLSSFEVRILDQDKRLSDKLGDNNSVFLQLTRANRNLPMVKNAEINAKK